MDVVEEFSADLWQAAFSDADRIRALEALEDGRVLYFPRLAFAFGGAEAALLTRDWAGGSRKNVSLDPARGIGGLQVDAGTNALLTASLRRFADDAEGLLHRLLPAYRPALARARTSFRPVEIAGRAAPSYRKDDTRLHVDAFPSRPTGGTRILRVFCNANPQGAVRAWRLGEPFADCARRFVARLPAPRPGSAALLRALGVTKGRRSPYDHYMLQLHDRMKADLEYQRSAPQQAFDFPAGSTWIVFSDQVLHAAHGGRFLLEQTFHLPVAAQAHPERSPLRVLEALTGRALA